MQLSCKLRGYHFTLVDKLDTLHQYRSVRHTVSQLEIDKAQLKPRILEGYRHNLPIKRGNLYQAIRHRLGLSRVAMAALLGIKPDSVRYRERQKQLYHPAEVVVLFSVSGMTPDDFLGLMRDIA